jgi:hypothetical protein
MADHTQRLLRSLLPLVMLIGAALACGPRPQEPDSQQSVRQVFETITAEANMPPQPTTVGADEVPATDTPPAPTTAPTATPPDSRSANGETRPIARCQQSITIDADSSEWDFSAGGVWDIAENVFGAGNWNGAGDASGKALLCWTDSSLYIAVNVTDDVHVQTQTGQTAWQGDEVELFFDANLRADFYEDTVDSDDSQLGLSPGDFDELPPAAVRYAPSFLDNINVELAASRPVETGGNYFLEVAIPWSILSVNPQPDTNYGLCLTVSDNDQEGEAVQDSMVSDCEDLFYRDPTTWETVRLMP